MKAIKLFALAVALAFAATMAITPNATAASAGSRSNVVALQGQQPATPQQTTPQQAEPGAQGQQAQAQTFTGTIKSANGEYVLYVPASRTAYKLDDQSKAKQFEGQTVTVQGVLDSNTNTIKVSAIQPASAQ